MTFGGSDGHRCLPAPCGHAARRSPGSGALPGLAQLLLTLVFAGWLLADDLRSRPSPWRWVALALGTGGALLSDYCVIHLDIASVALITLVWWRGRAAPARAAAVTALAAGAVLFVPVGARAPRPDT